MTTNGTTLRPLARAMLSSALLATLLSASLWSTAASADWRLGAKAGVMQVGFDEATVDDDPLNAGVSIGYGFDSVLQGLALELELTRSISPGAVAGADLDVDTQGLYATYSTSGRYYLKGRLGIMDASLGGELAEDEGGETYGVAVGWRSTRHLAVELDYTSIDDDVTFVSVGAVYRFAR